MIEKINTPIPLPVLNSSPKPLAKSACSGEIKVKGEYNLLGHTNVEAQRILHNSADNGGYGDTDQQAALDLPYHQRYGNNQADHRQDHGRIVESSQSDRGRLAETTIPAFLKPIKAIKRPIPPLIAFFQGHGDGVYDGGTQTGNSNQDKDDTGQEHGSQTSLPGKPIEPQMV